MERKKVSFWIWLAVILLLVCLFTCLICVRIHPGDENAVLADQTVNLLSVAVYLAIIFVGHPLAFAALAVGALFGELFGGYYHYIIPTMCVAALQYLMSLVIRRGNHRPWRHCILLAAVVETVMLVFYLLYDLILLGTGFGEAMRMFGYHILQGIVGFGIGLVLLKLFYEHWNGGREEMTFGQSAKKPRRDLK